MKIYTKAGDAGETGLVDGSRVRKDNARVAAYGDVDELSSALGVARAHCDDPAAADLLHHVQKDLFAIGAQLADPTATVADRKRKAAVTDAHVAALEHAIDERDGALPRLTTFVLPGGTPLAAHLHVARTVCRRAERAVVSLVAEGGARPLAIVYLNRLSDLLFVLAREANHRAGRPEEPW